MGYTTAVPEGTTYGNFHVPCWLLSFPRELGLMAVKVAQVVLDFTIPDMTISFHFPQQVFTYTCGHTTLCPHPASVCVWSHLWAPHSQGTLLQMLWKLWSLENHDHHVCIAPAHLHTKWGFGHCPHFWMSQCYVERKDRRLCSSDVPTSFAQNVSLF